MSEMHKIKRHYHMSTSFPPLKFGQILELVEILENRQSWTKDLDTVDYWNRVFDDIQLKTEDGTKFPEMCFRGTLEKLWVNSYKFRKRQNRMESRNRSSFSMYSLEKMIPIIEEFMNSEDALEMFYSDYPRIPRFANAASYFIHVNKPPEDSRPPIAQNFPKLSHQWRYSDPEVKLKYQEDLNLLRQQYLLDRDAFLENHMHLPNIEEILENASWRNYEYKIERNTKLLNRKKKRKELKSDIVDSRQLDLDGFKLFCLRNREKYAEKYEMESTEELEKLLKRKYDKLPLVRRLKLDREIQTANKALKKRIRHVNNPYLLKERISKKRTQYTNPVTGENTKLARKGRHRLSREKEKIFRNLKEVDHAGYLEVVDENPEEEIKTQSADGDINCSSVAVK